MVLSTDARIDQIAADQLGLVTRRQLLGAGIDGGRIDRRIAAGRLRQMHRGVYRVGPVPAPRAREMSAVLACGSGAVVSHRSAAALWGLIPDPSEAEPVDVTLVGADRGRRPGIRAHRVLRLAEDERAAAGGVPVTSPARTVVDLAPSLGMRELETTLARAERRSLLSLDEMRRATERTAGVPGAPRLRALLAAGAPALTRSEAEERFLEMVRAAGLPRPEVNARVAGVEVDFLFRSERVVVEIDGYAHHGSERAFARDRRRDARLFAAGWVVLRFTWAQITDGQLETVSLLTKTLARPR